MFNWNFWNKKRSFWKLPKGPFTW